MKVKLIDLDYEGKLYRCKEIGRRKRIKTTFPNLALMKLASWHKVQGDELSTLPLDSADKTYIACVFPWNKNRMAVNNGDIIGGTGFGNDSPLPVEIEHIMPDYSLYDADYSIGFTSRGCIRKCPWCVVPEKEGAIKDWADLYEFWDRRHKLIVLLDNNFLAAPSWKQTMQTLILERVAVDFNQGLDIRLINDENSYYLAKIKTPRAGGRNRLRFAFDSWAYHAQVEQGIILLRRAGISLGSITFYVLMGFDQSAEEDYARLEMLKQYGCAVFPMIYRDKEGKQHFPSAGAVPENLNGSRIALINLKIMKQGFHPSQKVSSLS
jgi:hypothetical protein